MGAAIPWLQHGRYVQNSVFGGNTDAILELTDAILQFADADVQRADPAKRNQQPHATRRRPDRTLRKCAGRVAHRTTANQSTGPGRGVAHRLSLAVDGRFSMNWRDRLLPASFRGVGFWIDQAKTPVGRKGQLHEYPQRD